MSTFYLDYEAGNDANSGVDFANRWKTLTTGATAARIAPGDTIRIMGSPAATSLAQNGTWTDGPLKATVAITSSTNATPIVITSATHSLTTGDTVVITGHTTNTFANGTYEVTVLTSTTFSLNGSTGNGVGGATGTVRNVNNCRVMLTTTVSKNIVKCDAQTGAWTASANVTATTNTADYKDGYGSSSIAIAAGFATGLAAYKAFTGVTDYSAYKQISFWIKQTSGTLGAAGAITISLCTDAIGAVAAQTVNVPAITALNQWLPVTVDTGAALSAVAQSLAINVVTDNGAQTFLLDSFTACKDSTSADALTLQSMIGKNTGNETWCAIAAMQGTRVMLDQGVNSLPTDTTYRGYSGTSEAVTAYKKETIKTALAAASLTSVQQIMDTGTLAGGYINFEGGWNRTDMSTQTLDTWFDGGNGLGGALSFASTYNFISINKISFIRYNRAFSCNGQYNLTIDNMSANNCTVVGGIGAIHIANSWAITVGTIQSCSYNMGPNGNYAVLFQGNTAASLNTLAHMYHCDGNGMSAFAVGLGGAMITKSIFSDLMIQNNNAVGLLLNGAADCVFKTVTSKNNATYGLQCTASTGNILYSLTTTGNSTAGFGPSGNNYLVDASIAESTEVNSVLGQGAYTFSQGHDVTPDNTQIFTDGGRISSTTAVRHTASGFAWQFAPTNAARVTNYPLILSLATVMCKANALVTVSGYFRRDNTGITTRLVCKGGQITGVSSDRIATISAAADTWELLTITFTPTVQGAVEITAEAYGGTTFNAYVDDLSIAQA